MNEIFDISTFCSKFALDFDSKLIIWQSIINRWYLFITTKIDLSKFTIIFCMNKKRMINHDVFAFSFSNRFNEFSLNNVQSWIKFDVCLYKFFIWWFCHNRFFDHMNNCWRIVKNNLSNYNNNDYVVSMIKTVKRYQKYWISCFHFEISKFNIDCFNLMYDDKRCF